MGEKIGALISTNIAEKKILKRRKNLLKDRNSRLGRLNEQTAHDLRTTALQLRVVRDTFCTTCVHCAITQKSGSTVFIACEKKHNIISLYDKTEMGITPECKDFEAKP